MKPVYMEVTKDKYALPLAVSDSMWELARMRKTHVSNVIRGVEKSNRGGRERFVRVWLDDKDFV